MFWASGVWCMQRSCCDSARLESELVDGRLLESLSVTWCCCGCVNSSLSSSDDTRSDIFKSSSNVWLVIASPSGVAGREGVPNRSVSEGMGVGDAHLASLTDDHSELIESLSSVSSVISRKLVSSLSAQFSHACGGQGWGDGVAFKLYNHR